jgi:hypothetical protein
MSGMSVDWFLIVGGLRAHRGIAVTGAAAELHGANRVPVAATRSNGKTHLKSVAYAESRQHHYSSAMRRL